MSASKRAPAPDDWPPGLIEHYLRLSKQVEHIRDPLVRKAWNKVLARVPDLVQKIKDGEFRDPRGPALWAYLKSMYRSERHILTRRKRPWLETASVNEGITKDTPGERSNVDQLAGDILAAFILHEGRLSLLYQKVTNNLTLEQLAEQLGCSVWRVRQRIKKELRHCLARIEDLEAFLSSGVFAFVPDEDLRRALEHIWELALEAGQNPSKLGRRRKRKR